MINNKLYSNIPRNGLVGEWLLDGNAFDTNDGTKNNGTATNITWVNTEIGYQKQAGSFNGSSSKVVVTDIENIRTISVWITKTNLSNNFNMLFTTNSNSKERYIGQIYSNGYLYSNIGNGNISLYHGITKVNKWYHIVLTVNGTNFSLYNNGKLISTISSQQNLFIGNIGTGNNGYYSGYNYDGNIRLLRIYNRTLLQSEIQNLYIEGLRKLGAGSDNILSSAVVYYDFNGDANDIINGNNGTVVGATLTNDHFGINRGYNFTSNNCSININNLPTISTGEYTLFGWFYPTVPATSGDYNIVWRWSTGVANQEPIYMYYGGYGDNRYRVLMQTTSNQYFGGIFNKTFFINTWYQITITVGGGNVKIYFNGVLDQTFTYSGTAYTQTTGFSIGNRGYNMNEGWEGRIGNTIIFNKALSDNEVKELYNLSKTRYLYSFKKQLPLNFKNQLMFFGSGDISNNTYLDVSGNGYNGTMTNVFVGRIGQHKYVGNMNSTTKIQFNSKILDSTYNNGNFSISFWAYNKNSIQQLDDCIFSNANDNGCYGLNIAVAIEGTSIYEIFYGDGGGNWINLRQNTFTLDVNKWTHIVYTKQGTTVKIYKNGKLYATYTQSSSNCNFTNSYNAVLLSHTMYQTRYWEGNIKDFMIFPLGKVLNINEVQQLYYSTYIQ